MDSFNRDKVINNMCMTFRHDYGLMEESEGRALFNQMAQIFDNDISYHLMTQSDVDDYEEKIGELEEELEKEKDLHSLTRNRFKEADKHIEKLKHDRDYWKLSFKKQVEVSRR